MSPDHDCPDDFAPDAVPSALSARLDAVQRTLIADLLAQGLQAAGYLRPRRPDARGWRDLLAFWPSVSGLARLWGSFDPARAAGALAAMGHAPLRAVGRAAAMEFAPWPAVTVAGVLRRAEADALDPAWLRAAEPERLTELFDAVAVAWARHQPDELPKVHERLYGRLGRIGACGLWAADIRDTAAARQLLPSPGELLPDPPRRLVGVVYGGATPIRRARACLALAAHIWRVSDELRERGAGGDETTAPW